MVRWLKGAWGGWFGVVTTWVVVLAVGYLVLVGVWWAVDETGVLDATWTCADMDDRGEAQDYLKSEQEHNDRASIDALDADGDGKACESHVFDAVAPDEAEAAEPSGEGACHPSYPDACLDPDASDYDCSGGEGNGPKYVAGPIEVDWGVDDPDPFDLDRDGDGSACEWAKEFPGPT